MNVFASVIITPMKPHNIICSIPASAFEWLLTNSPVLGFIALIVWLAWKFNKSIDHKFEINDARHSKIESILNYLWIYTNSTFEHQTRQLITINQEIINLREGQTKLEVGLANVNGRIDVLDSKFTAKFEEVGRRFDMIDKKFDAVDDKFTSIDNRFKSIDDRFKSMDDRFDRLESKIDARFDAQNQVNIQILSILKSKNTLAT